MEKATINGVEIFPFQSFEELRDYAKQHKGILVATNAEKIIKMSNRLRNIINANIGYCDGEGPVKTLRRKGYKVVRIAGCELWLKLISADPNATFYFVGSTEDTIQATVKKMADTHPNINIVGYRNGFIKSDEEKVALLNDIEEKKPDYVFVAMGSPRQEYLMEEMKERHLAIYQGLGGSFDLFVGNFKRAPKWIQKINGEWAWRFIAQPSRIGRLKPYLQYAYRMYTNKL